MSDLISVCIPAYGKRFLAETLESLMKQDYRPFEIVIGDDRPDAVDEALLNAMRTDEGITVRYIPNRPRLGQAGNVNMLFREARGAWIAIMHDDDLMMPGSLSALHAGAVRHPGASVVYGRVTMIDAAGTIDAAATARGNRDFGRTPDRAGAQSSALAAAVDGRIPHNGFLVRADLARAVLYRPREEVGDVCDYDFGIRLALAAPDAPFVFVDHDASACRRWGGQISASSRSGIFALGLLDRLEPRNAEEKAAVGRAAARHAAIALCEHARAGSRGAALRLLFSGAYWSAARPGEAAYHALLILSPDLAGRVMARLRLGRRARHADMAMG
ncbi:glycosyltransferase (plasmid) [Skermanella mucosa]|uniref:glycosyltransferase family 2 protein n=1 Tax=Skermanella mucosa TaxID=1789672 RepID=UPI00192B2E5B|nr:glycosyltransferase family A protein [Skermanella mucosa]UEM24974.1 glycosyltransferase [Skermanella mucosa]